jgi:hypothetical protein
MSRIDAAMLLGVYAVVAVSILIGPLGFLAVGHALQHVGIRVVALAIAAGFTAGSLVFSAAVRRGDDTREQETDPGPAGDLASILSTEARPD